MSGKLCVGEPLNNIGAARIDESRAFCEGLAYRMSGTVLTRPIADNPHLIVDSPDHVAWDNGWGKADNAAGGALPTDEGRCCAVDRGLVIAA
jgi:hypothetical protein